MKFGKRVGPDAEKVEYSNSCDFGINVFLNFLRDLDLRICQISSQMEEVETFHLLKLAKKRSGKFSTKVEKFPVPSYGAQILQTRRSRCRKTIFAKVENFPPKVEECPPLPNVPIHVILEYFFLEVENFPLKCKIFHFPRLGSD